MRPYLIIALPLLFSHVQGGPRDFPPGLIPEITIGMSTGDTSDSKLRGIEPVLRWSGGRRVGDVEIEASQSLQQQRSKCHEG